MAEKKYQGMTFEEMNALVNKQYSSLTPEEKAIMGQLTKQDYNDYAREKNWATSTPTYTGWNGGSVTGQDSWQASMDSIQHGYDVWLDPRNNHDLHNSIQNMFRDVDQKANEMAIAGQGDYDTNRADLLAKTGWKDYQTLFNNLQTTGSLGLTDLDGNDLTEMALAARNKMLPGVPYELTPEMQAMMQNEYAAMVARANNVDPYLSPLMQNQGAGGQGGAWGYNQEEDSVWAAILKQYARAGEKGMNDVLAQLSARTGGLASSYAGQVAQQTMNDYMQGATDMIPQLEQQAYERDLTERQMAIDAEQRQYERQVAAEQTAWERQIYQQQLAADQQAQNANLLLSLMQGGYMPTEEELAAAGLSQGVANHLNAAYQNNLALEWAKANKTSGGGGKQDPETLDYIAYLNDYGAKDYDTAYLALLSMGLKSDDAASAATSFMNLLEGQGPEDKEPVIDSGLDQVFEELGNMSLGDYADMAGNINEVGKEIQKRIESGYTNEEIQQYILWLYEHGGLLLNDYVMLKAKYA